MNKKIFVLGMMLAFVAPVFAQEQEMQRPPLPNGPKMHMPYQVPSLNHKPFNKEEMKAKQAEFKQTQEKLEKLTKEYKKAKKDSKKQMAAKEEIAKIVGEMRDKQIAQRREGLASFEKRLDEMKNKLAEEEKPEVKEAWVAEMTDRLIEQDGSFKALLNEKRNKEFKKGKKFLKKGPGHAELPPPPPPPPLEIKGGMKEAR